jgi:hypothetical protein
MSWVEEEGSREIARTERNEQQRGRGGKTHQAGRNYIKSRCREDCLPRDGSDQTNINASNPTHICLLDRGRFQPFVRRKREFPVLQQRLDMLEIRLEFMSGEI